MNLLSYLQSWHWSDPGTTLDRGAYGRFMDWMDNPKIVKTRRATDWADYTYSQFIDDTDDLNLDVGTLRKNPDIAAVAK